jgi:hypothetical protein
MKTGKSLADIASQLAAIEARYSGVSYTSPDVIKLIKALRRALLVVNHYEGSVWATSAVADIAAILSGENL